MTVAQPPGVIINAKLHAYVATWNQKPQPHTPIELSALEIIHAASPLKSRTESRADITVTPAE